MDEERLARPRSGPRREERWTSPDDYVAALARRRTARRSREGKPRTQPEAPRFSLSTLPFLVLLGALLIIAIGIAIAAWPGAQPQPRDQVASHERGVAEKGWFQEAEKEMRRQ